jgi:spore maturation protein A
MLNYVWIGLIVTGIVTAAALDVRNEAVNAYRNGIPLEAVFVPHRVPGPLRSSWEGTLVVPAAAFSAFYGGALPAGEIRAGAVIGGDGRTLTLSVGEGSPQVWREMARAAASRDGLSGSVGSIQWAPDGQSAFLRFTLEPVRFVRLRAVTQAAFEYAGTAVSIAIGLIGIMALWLGVMKVAEEAGILRFATRLLAPLMRRLFPDVPPDHPAASAMLMNIAANMLGLSNAATPLGLKAMEELNKLSPKAGTATNAMCTFLAINTGGLILIPATALAVRAAAGSANPGIIIGTSFVGAACATVAGVTAAKILEKLPRYRKALEADHG